METEASAETIPVGEVASTLSAPSGLFVRNATGLVRELSQRDNFMIAAMPGLPGLLVAISVFYILGGLPGGNLFIGGLLCIPMIVAFSLAFGLLTSVIPRSGGDYTLVTRILSGPAGLISSFCMVVGGIALAAGALGKLFDTLAVAPSLQTIGLVTNSHTLFHWGTTLMSSKAWQLVLGMLPITIGAAIHFGGIRLAKRALNWSWIISTIGLLFAVVVALLTSRSSFAGDFNHFAQPFTHLKDSYGATIAAASKAGVDVHSSFSFAKTIPVIGFFATISVYTYNGSFVAGELRQAATSRTAYRMVGGGIFALLILLLAAAALLHSYGQPFLTAAYGGGLPPQLGTLPSYFALSSFQLGSPVIAVLSCLAFCITFAVLEGTFILLALTRVLFAWSFDGILPARAASVSKRTHAPTIAIVLSWAICAAAVAWATFDGGTFIQVIVYATLIQMFAMILVGVSATVLPWRRPELYRASGVTSSLAGIPVVTLAGLASIVSGIFIFWMFFHYSYFGLATTSKFFAWWGGTMAAAVVYYALVRWFKARRGIDLSLVYREIPPE